MRFSRFVALREEFEHVAGIPVPGGEETDLHRAALDRGLSALCLSGGGIRSASFCLGVVQALARTRLLARFDYLSTVSGGGYIGSWLQNLIHQEPAGDLEAVQAGLAASDPAVGKIAALRNYTKYLSPEAGLFSLDLWTDAVLWLRNTLLTWAVYLPLVALAITLAILYRTLIWASAGWPQPYFIAVAVVPLVIATYNAARLLPDHRPQRGGLIAYADPGQISWGVYLPALLWAFIAPLSQGMNPEGVVQWQDWTLHLVPAVAEGSKGEYLLPVAYAAARLLGYGAAWISDGKDTEKGLFARNFPAWGFSIIVSGSAIYAGLVLAHAVPASGQAQAVAVFGPLWLLAAAGLHTAVYVGFRRGGRLLDLDREWLARLSALELRAGVLWALFAGACLILSWVTDQYGSPAMATFITSAGAGPIAAWLGKQATAKVEMLWTRGDKGQVPLTLLLNALAGLFLAATIALLGFVIDKYLLGSFMQHLIADRWIRGCQPAASPITSGLARQFDPPSELAEDYCEDSLLQPFIAVVVLFVVLSGATYLVGRVVNVNRYTMHAVYRNRLTRAFLGSARADGGRHAEPFSEFDPDDNVPLAALLRRSPDKLFPVINMTLNQTYGGAAAWSDRKALAFTATPLACGAPLLPGSAGEGAASGAYVPTRCYAGRESPAETGDDRGLTLATAMAISGAAVSPNWGYHSSSLTAFIMTLFNVRLGAWLPNPAADLPAAKLALAMAPDRLRSLAGDLLGISSATDSAIYLSDGGHFDNLGVYEMLRRRCRCIVVIDAGEDGSCTYQDLGNALRKAAIDMGITVEFRAPWRIAARTDTEQQRQEALGFLIGKIKYPEAPRGQACRLLYLKPSLLDDVPADVRAYANMNQQFPHEPTWDQWFTEAQFESYRKLGEFQTGKLLALCRAHEDGGIELPELFLAADRAYAQTVLAARPRSPD